MSVIPERSETSIRENCTIEVMFSNNTLTSEGLSDGPDEGATLGRSDDARDGG